MTTIAEIHRELAESSPARRRELVLSLLQRTSRLDLASSSDDRAVLSDADFSTQVSVSHAQPGPSRADRGGIVCRGAQLANATLDGTNWSGADLSASDLTGCRARLARFDEAILEDATFDRSDLVGSTFLNASLGEASFRSALLEDADFSGARLRFANFSRAILEGARLERTDLWGATLDEASLEGASLANAVVTEGSLKGARLRGVNLSGADLGRVDLSGADLTDADLRGARPGGATLRDAVLRNARLEGVDLSTCDLTHAHLSNVWLERTILRAEQLGDAVGEERALAYLPARRAYLALQRNFETLGDGDAASWAYRRRRRMQKLEDRVNARREWRAGRRRSAAAFYVTYISDQAAELLCDYGESVPRVLAAMALVYLTFTILYGISGGVLRLVPGSNGPGDVTRNPFNLALFSLLSLVSAGEGIGLVPSGPVVQVMRALEALMGIGLTGLLGFVLGNRINR